MPKRERKHVRTLGMARMKQRFADPGAGYILAATQLLGHTTVAVASLADDAPTLACRLRGCQRAGLQTWMHQVLQASI